MKNLLLYIIACLFFTGCGKEVKEEPVTLTLKGKWFAMDLLGGYDRAGKSIEVLEFGDNTFKSVFNEKMVTLPDCTLIYQMKRTVNSDYYVDNRFIRFTNMRSDTNDVAEYTGKTAYMYYYTGRHELYLYPAEIWQQLSGTNGQIYDGLFYQLDSSRSIHQDTIRYHHHKLEFSGNWLDYYHLTNGTREMPDENAAWGLECYQTVNTDSTFECSYNVYYQFIDGLMISHGRRGQFEVQRTYNAY